MKQKKTKASIRQGAYGTNPKSKQRTTTRTGQGNKRASRNPTNNGLVQGRSNSAWPMFGSPNNTPARRKTKGAFPFTGSSGTSY